MDQVRGYNPPAKSDQQVTLEPQLDQKIEGPPDPWHGRNYSEVRGIPNNRVYPKWKHVTSPWSHPHLGLRVRFINGRRPPSCINNNKHGPIFTVRGKSELIRTFLD